MLRLRLVVLVSAVALLVPGCRTEPLTGRTAVTGNGVSELTAQEILDRAKGAAANAGSVHVRGRLTSRGAPVTLDIRVTQAPSAVGSITMSGQTISLVRTGSTGYVKGSDSFYRSAGIRAMPKRLQGKWLKVPAGGKEFAGLAGFTVIERVFALFLASPPPLVKGEEHLLEGIRTIGVTDGEGRTVHVAMDGEPLPVRISVLPDGSGEEGVDFLEYDQPFLISAPPKSSVVDINQLTKAAG